MQDTIETQTPYYASLTDEQLTAALGAKEAEYERIRAEVNRLTDSLRSMNKDLTALREVQAERRQARMRGPDWAYLLGLEGFDTRAKHNALRAALEAGIEPAQYDWFAIRTSGMFAEEPLQMCVQVGLVRGCPQLTATVTQKLRQLLPAVLTRVPRKVRNDDQRPYKLIRLFEHSLSHTAVYFLAINEELQMYEVRSMRHSFESVMARAESLDQLMALVEDRYFYQQAEDRPTT